MIAFCSEFYAEKTFDNKALHRVRLKDVLAERLKAPRVVGRNCVKQGFLLSKKEVDRSNGQKIHSHFDTNVRKLYFGGKFLYYCINCIFDFSLKGY